MKMRISHFDGQQYRPQIYVEDNDLFGIDDNDSDVMEGGGSELAHLLQLFAGH